MREASLGINVTICSAAFGKMFLQNLETHYGLMFTLKKTFYRHKIMQMIIVVQHC